MPALVAGVIALGAIAGFFVTRAAQRGPSSADLQTAARFTADAVTARLEADAHLLAAASASIGGNPALPTAQLQEALRGVAPPGAVLGIASGSTDTAATVTVGVPDTAAAAIVGTALASRPDWRLVLELARDGDTAGAILLDGPDGDPAVLDTFPLYGTASAPTDIAGRRQSVAGFVVSLTPASTMVGLVPAPDSDVTVVVFAGPTRLGAAGRGALESPPSSAVSLPVSVGNVAWTVQAWSTPGSSRLPWLVLGVGLALALGMGALVGTRERSLALVVTETEARNQELALVARTGPLLQQSLALGDLLPVFVVEVSDELGLDGISVSLCDDAGELVRVFSLGAGAGPSRSIDTLAGPPESVDPGGIVTVPLHRAGRVVGAFQARAVSGLTAPQMDALTAVCALLASAAGNVRLFQDEQELVGRLREVDKMKTSFIGSVSHELRTSVTAILGFAELLEASDAKLDSQRRADYVERISRNARSLNVLVEDLLDFARFERSGLTAALRPIDLTDLVPKVVDQMSSVLNGREVSTRVDQSVVAVADSLAVERVLVNLLSNAAKYTPPGSPVDVELARDGDVAVLSVSDHGPGIPEEEREKVFELFYRSDQSARVTRGVGIGLALARQLVAHLNGTILVDETPGGGARFRVTIPLVDGSNSGGTDVEAS